MYCYYQYIINCCVGNENKFNIINQIEKSQTEMSLCWNDIWIQ